MKISELPVITAVTDATAKIPVVESGATSYITPANLAADSAFAAPVATAQAAAQAASLAKASNLSDLTNAGTARTNLGLGTAATTASTAYATAAQGTTADAAVPKSLYDANTVLYATTDNTPVALPVGASTVVGRAAAGNIVALTGGQAAQVATPSTSITSSATPTPDSDAVTHYYVTALAAGATFGAPTGTPVAGQSLVIGIKDNGTARSLAFNAAFVAIGVTLPTTTVVGKWTYIGAKWNATASKWHVLAVNQEA